VSTGDTLRVDWEALKAAKAKLRKLTVEAENATDPGDRANMTHTAYKLGSFLDEALHGALSKLDSVDRLTGSP
jgi:hypothetical protein